MIRQIGVVFKYVYMLIGRMAYYINKKYLEEKIYDEVTEDMFDMSNVRIFKEIEKKKKMEDVYKSTLLCLSSVKRLA